MTHFTRWPFAPAPYDPRATDWNVPAGMRDLPWGAVRSHSDPRLINPNQHLRGTMWLPWKARTAYSGAHSGLPAMLAVSQADRRMATMAQQAIAKSAAGLPITQMEALAIMTPHLPPVVRQQPRSGPGLLVHSSRVPPRAGVVPPSVQTKAAQLRQPFAQMQAADDAKNRAIGMLQRARAAMMLPVLRDLGRRK